MGLADREKSDLMPHNRPQGKDYSCVYRLIGTYRLFSNPFRYIIPRLFLVFLIIISTASVSFAQSHERLFNDDPAEPWHITADEISFDKKTNQHIAKGNVVITKQDKRLTADFVRFDDKTMEVLAVGHVIMTAGEDMLVGDKMEMDLEAEIGTAYNGTIFIKENHFYIKGDKIQKTGKNSYAVDKGSLTTCDGDRPAWKITGRNLKVTMEGYGFVNHAALWVKKVPVLYTPFLVFPAKTKRQSGLLLPQIVYSERKWEEYIQPFYWAINESSDATLYYHHIGRRGEKIGFEYRYVLDEKSKGTMMYDFLQDSKTDNGTLESSEEWGYTDDSVLRPNSDRYWFRMKHDQSLPFDFSAKLDIDIVSDQDYLHEFKGGYTGFEKTDNFFNKSFGRDLDEYDDSTRVNSLSINKSWSQFSLNAETRWYDNVITRRQEEKDTTIQMLPIVDFNASKQQVFGTPFYFDLDSEYTYFYREDDSESAPRAHRMDAYPRLYLPLQFKHYFSFEPSVGFRETVWYFDKEEYSSSDKATLSREIYDVKIDLSSNIYRIYNLQTSWINKIKHAITPQVIYQYIPGKDQSNKYPQFDAVDNIARTNLVTYSLTNIFTSKAQTNNTKKDSYGESDKNESDNDGTPNYTYNQFCRLKLEQSYNINEAKEDNPSNRTNKKEKRPFSTIYGEIEIAPVKYVSARADTTWSQHESNFKTHNVSATLTDERGDSLFVEHRYAQDLSESIYTDISLVISEQLKVYADYERNIYGTQDIRKSVGCLYEAQCWSIDFYYTHEDNDRQYAFIINLYGLGQFGKGIGGRTMEKPL